MSAPHAIPDIEPLAPGAHPVDSDGITQRYHGHGRGPICLAHLAMSEAHLLGHPHGVLVAAYHPLHRHLEEPGRFADAVREFVHSSKR
ncbi:hypothetical protein ACQP1G_06855 [Nocardia sp. CA-107356]|uniref:hypothetical protein n=1 Tax=Nocardia sp. CA-107356 TaxID=3239972 RepID=UPI003D923FB7